MRLRRVLGERTFPYGLLVAVPFRHQLAFHPIADHRVVVATQFLAGLAADGYSDGVGPVSPSSTGGATAGSPS